MVTRLWTTKPRLFAAVKKLNTVTMRLGFSIVPNHFYEPVPDVAELRRSRHWTKPFSMKGVDLQENDQLRFLRDVVPKYIGEGPFGKVDRAGPFPFTLDNGTFGPIDAEVLYCWIRWKKPRRIVEIGSGNSTKLMLTAVERNQTGGHVFENYLAIDPHPPRFLRDLRREAFTLEAKRVQDVGFEPFESLQEGDVLFVDSSHVSKAGSDVNRLILEVLPRLAKGVLVHFHDIFWPEDYTMEHIVKDHWSWNEQYILHAMLIGNRDYAVEWSANFMATRHGEAVARAIPSCRPGLTRAGSVWLRKTS